LVLLIVSAILYETSIIIFGIILNQLIKGISSLYVLVVEVFAFSLLISVGTSSLIAYVLLDTISRYKYYLKVMLSSLSRDERFIYKILMIKGKVSLEYLIKLFGDKRRLRRALLSLKNKKIIKVARKKGTYYISLR